MPVTQESSHAMEGQEEAKLQRFLQWLQVNGAELRGCEIKYCDSKKGFGIFSSGDNSEGIILVVPLDLAITPMRVLQDSIFGPTCQKLFEAEDVDDRFLMTLFLTVERACENSSWKPYLDMLPSTFGTPLWFTDDELLELKGTALHRATELQEKNLQTLFNNKAKHLAEELILLHGESGSTVHFEDFLWANTVFWTRAMNIPFPRSCVFPQFPAGQENCSVCLDKASEAQVAQISDGMMSNGKDENCCHFSGGSKDSEATPSSMQIESAWVEGIVPGIDFCNHDFKAKAVWQVDETGCTTGVPMSIYLLSDEMKILKALFHLIHKLGNAGLSDPRLRDLKELLYLYGFVFDNNPDDYLMVHYPIEAFQDVYCADAKAQLLQIQKAEMRCLLPRSLLSHGLFSGNPPQNEDKVNQPNGQFRNYSWSGQRKVPSYLNKLVFPECFLAALRTIAMQEDELLQVMSLLEELVGFDEERQPSDTEVQTAVWEVCGDAGALQMLVDLLKSKITKLEEGSGTETSDTELLEKACIVENGETREEFTTRNQEHGGKEQQLYMSRNRWSCIVYRRGQKQLTRLFLREAEHALQLCLSEQ